MAWAAVASGNGERRNATDEVIDSALRYRVQAPMVDSLMAELGIDGGRLSQMGGLVRDARDLQSIAREASRGGEGPKGSGAAGGGEGSPGGGSGGGESSGGGDAPEEGGSGGARSTRARRSSSRPRK